MYKKVSLTYPSSAQCVVLGAIVVGFVVLVVVEITSLPPLNIYAVLLAQVLHYHGWQVLGFRLYIIGTQELPICLQPSAEGISAYARCAG